jgi:hypothetical protein
MVQHIEQGRPQREILDALGGPFGFELRARNAPDLFRVRFEEGQEEPLPEAIRHPLLERVLAPIGEELPAEITQQNQDTFEEA